MDYTCHTINQKINHYAYYPKQAAACKTAYVILFSFSILSSCKKVEFKEPSSENVSSAANTTASGCDVTICEDCSFQETIENDTTQYATILGGTYSNPIPLQT